MKYKSFLLCYNKRRECLLLRVFKRERRMDLTDYVCFRSTNKYYIFNGRCSPIVATFISFHRFLSHASSICTISWIISEFLFTPPCTLFVPGLCGGGGVLPVYLPRVTRFYYFSICPRARGRNILSSASPTG